MGSGYCLLSVRLTLPIHCVRARGVSCNSGQHCYLLAITHLKYSPMLKKIGDIIKHNRIFLSV